MEKIRKLALLYLLGLCLVAWGFAIGRYEVFPADHMKIREIEAFVGGHVLEPATTVGEKLQHELGTKPARYVYEYPPKIASDTHEIRTPGLRDRRDHPYINMAPGHADGYRAIFGAIDFETSFWGGLLIDQNGEVVHVWHLNTSHLSDVREDLKILYGLTVYPDGSVIFTQQEDGGGIVKVDACSNMIWDIPGEFHHTISPAADDSFWTFKGSQYAFDHVLARYSAESGEELETIDMSDVRERNDKLHIFNLQAQINTSNISHGNDIEPLPAELSPLFPQFDTGDLLVSYRTQNLVFVLDPDSYRVRWWRVGAWDKQHDPDWESDGRIYVFSNNHVADRQYSDIVSIDPRDFRYDISVDGESYGIYSTINGHHQRSSYGTRMITSSTQGIAVEVDPNGSPVFTFVNAYDRKENTALHLSEAMRFDDDYFEGAFWEKCSG